MDTKPPYYDHFYYYLHFSTHGRIKLGFLQSCFIFSPRFYDLTPLIWFRFQNFIWVRSNQKWIIWMWNVGVQVLLMLYELGGNKSLHCLFFYPPADSSTPDPWHLSAPQTCALCVFYNIAWYVSTRFCICICMCICICICIYIWICICICICTSDTWAPRRQHCATCI